MRYTFESIADMPSWARAILLSVGGLIVETSSDVFVEKCPYRNHPVHGTIAWYP